MTPERVKRLLGGFVFFYSLVLFGTTVAPTASFWDAGEFIAIANRLQVSHPPGAPFYMLLGRVASMFVSAPYVALAVNLVSVLASALTILLTYLIIVGLVREWQGPRETRTWTHHLVAYAGGIVGALTFAATDSFWFNAVESEVYALSMFFTAIVIWLIMRWAEEYRDDLASGRALHRYDLGPVTSRYLVIIAYLFGLATGVHLLNLLAVFFVALILFFEKFDREEWTPWQRLLGLTLTGVFASLAFFAVYPGVIIWLPELAQRLDSGTLTIGLIVAAIAAGLWYTQTRRLQIANVILMAITVVVIGYSTYALIFVRSAADPPIDENDPEDLTAIVSYLKREQYGDAPPLFDRMHSPIPQHQREYAQYGSEWEFFWEWQVKHMYIRYFMWNFVGRQSDVQDAGWTAGFDNTNAELHAMKTPSERASRNVYYGLPLLLGLIGFFYHVKRDWRRAFSVGILFVVTGIGIILYLNQTPPQPRERDYSYVASFFAFSLWIGIGAAGLVEFVTDLLRRAANPILPKLAGTGTTILLVAAVPVLMAVENYDDHDRSGRYVAPDYAYNLLNSLEHNAILFTNGDNDTFPLWYLQEVEGVRQDVRVACLSLMNTSWYLNQLKNQWSRDSEPVPMTLTDAQIAQIGVAPWQAQEVVLPVEWPQGASVTDIGVTAADSSRIENPMRWTVQGRPYSSDTNMLYVADQAVLSIIVQNAREGWRRPVYFANTTSRDSQMELQPYFQLEGLAYRIVPVRHNDVLLGRVVPEITVERLNRFRLRNLDDPKVYFDENKRRMMDNYRLTYAHAAQKILEMGDKTTAEALIDTLTRSIPFATIPSDPYTGLLVAQVLEQLGRRDDVNEVLKALEPRVLEEMDLAIQSRAQQRAARTGDYIGYIIYTYMGSGDFEAASSLYNRLADVTGDESYRQSPESLRQQFERESGLIQEGLLDTMDTDYDILP